MAGPGGRTAPTLESVAARAGVSRATAGRVLAGSSTVGEQARASVLRAADELSYVTNQAARSLMTRRSNSVAFVVAEPEERYSGDPHFAAQVMRGAQAVLAAHDVQLVFSALITDADRDRIERFARGGHLDGVILASMHGDDPLPWRLQRAGVPVVLSGLPFTAGSGVCYVDADNVGGARSAVRLMVERGRRRLATITGPMDMTAAHNRLRGFEAEMSAQGLPVHGRVEGDWSVAEGRQAMLDLLAADPRIDGVFAANDLMACGAVQAASETGRRVPADIAIVGFDDFPTASASYPRITTVRQPTAAMGEALARRLLAVIERGEPQEPMVLGTEIVVRETV